MYTITVKHHFDAAHRLYGYEGKCSNLHGHRWEAEIEISSEELHDGMVIDFNSVKKVIDVLDHGTILWDEDPLCNALYDVLTIFPLPYHPTAENIAYFIYTTLTCIIHKTQIVNCVTVWESPNAKATYAES